MFGVMGKKVKGKGMNDNHGRISVENGTNDIMCVLPEDLVHRILDRVPVRDAARTSILSRKWRFIWPKHPHLVFDRKFYEANFMNKPLHALSFTRAIGDILFLHNGPILKFYLYMPHTDLSWDKDILKWLSYLSRNGIKELSLKNYCSTPCKLPSYFFCCRELEYLQLRKFIIGLPNEFGGFGKLVDLDLREIALSDELLRTLVPGAPLLEVLTFTRCTGIQHFELRSPKLKIFISSESTNIQTMTLGSIPNLTYLSLKLKKMASSKTCTFSLVDLLNKFPKLWRLEFDGFFLKLLASGSTPWALSNGFHHMRHLLLSEFQFDDVAQISCLLCLLRNCNKLETLDIRASDVGDNALRSDASYLYSPLCWNHNSNSLQKVTISSIRGLKCELLFIQMMLTRAPVLGTVFVNYSAAVDATKALEISTELMSYCRASPKARIVYVK